MMLRLLTAAVLTAAVSSSCFAGENSRRFQVELEVLAGNTRDVLSTAYTARYKHGIKLRIAGSLGYLHFLARQYLQATQQSKTDLLRQIESLRAAYDRGDWQVLARKSRSLAEQYPLGLSTLSPRSAGPAGLASGRRIYRRLCLGCHEHPDRTREVPAPDLFAMAGKDTERELLARLISGVHGTPAVALRNPFSDQEIAGLAAYLKRHPSR